MVNIVMVVLGTLLFTVIGGGIGYFFWVRTRPMKVFWNARIYTDGGSIRPRKKDKDGNPLGIPLRDLRPYTKDVLQKVDKEHGVTVYRLRKLNAACNEPSSSSVEFWGKDDRVVNILKSGDSYCVMESGYDKETGEAIFQPLPFETSTMLQHQVILKKNRLKQERDVLAQITPWVVTGMVCMMLVIGVWMLTESYVTLGEMNRGAAKVTSEAHIEAAEIFREGALLYHGYDPEQVLSDNSGKLGLQDKPPSMN